VSYLSKLTITQLKRPAKATPAEQRRGKIIAKLEEQLELARASAEGRAHSVTKAAWGKDAEGNRVRVQREKRLTPWWWRNGDSFDMVVRYGAKPIELGKGKRALSVADLGALPEIIGTVIEAVRAGELDAAIEAVAGAPKLKLPSKAA
jgi:hypothetical protein